MVIRRMCSGLLLATAMGVAGLASAKEAPTGGTAGQPGQTTAQPGQPSAQPGQPSAQPGARETTAQGCPGAEAKQCSAAQVAGILEAINRCAIDTSKLALSKAQSDDVREYAQKQVDFHSRLERELTDALQSAGITPVDSDISNELQADEQQKLTALASSPDFDREYAAREVIGHAASFGLLHAVAVSRHAAERGEATGEESEQADAFGSIVTKAVEKLAKHEKKALELQSKVSGGPCGAAPTTPETTGRTIPTTH